MRGTLRRARERRLTPRRIVAPEEAGSASPLRVRQGTRSPASRRVAKKTKEKVSVRPRVSKKFVKLKQHYMSISHKMTPVDARNLVDNRQRPARNKEGRSTVGGRVVRWPWVIFQCRDVLQFG